MAQELKLGGDRVVLIEWMTPYLDEEIRVICTEDGACHRVNIGEDNRLILTSGYDSIEYPHWRSPGFTDFETYDLPVEIELPDDLDRLQKILDGAIWADEAWHCCVCGHHVYDDGCGISSCGHIRDIRGEDEWDWGGCGMVGDDTCIRDDEYAKSFAKLVGIVFSDDKIDDPHGLIDDLVHELSLQDTSIWMQFLGYVDEDVPEADGWLKSINYDDVPAEYFQKAIAWIQAADRPPLPPQDVPREWRMHLMALGVELEQVRADVDDCGLELKSYSKPGFCCWAGMRIFGALTQKRSLEAKWRSRGIEFYGFQPIGAFGA